MSRLYTLEDEQLDYGLDYESVLVVKELDQKKQEKGNDKDLQQFLSLQFYSRHQQQQKSSANLRSIQRLITEQKENNKKLKENKQINYKIKTPSLKPYQGSIISPKCQTKTPQLAKTIKSTITITPLNFKDSLQKIKLLVSKQQQKHQLDFSKFKKSIY
ncbi:unnamed protein product (macronuclear) [Paramecium tetraurelia]|uniref:Uncharacterized protein n=1 Tax=Paramecium tetraurelia TaxID=5888 RepID=A0CML1_PARTE|nr:uncharacterized protein GSPATT00008507001 [Paramecium tetraurelia]CAK72028.1 unnamed protein product [Paramecium tetraurelia]|eukprot:XP_001439425.1 hypothetical protein (macronuclear) [Paramecium tetraurelia strain d4-2]